MNCKNCGGELFFRNGTYLCNSCGTNFTLDSIYEDIDVCICYEENDSAGRRTRDSIVGQDIYRKLEEKKIATFYERISADGMAGDQLETSKISAIHKAKIVIVLGATVENFNILEEKYGDYFIDKAVIPFCIDVNPGSIPKTLSKIQAMSYSTIGWDKDLIKGIYNILGKEQSVDTSALYGRRKRKIIIGILIAVALTAAIAIVGWLLMKPADVNNSIDVSIPSTEPTIETTEKPLTQKEIYDNANELLEQGDLIGALELFLQIPDHPNSANAIKLIYAKYEGYYQSGNITIYLKTNNNTSASVKVTLMEGETIASFTDETEILSNSMSFEGVDNFHRVIQIEVKLENDGIDFKLAIDGNSDATSVVFPLSEKSDQPFVQMNKEMLLGWLDNQYTLTKLRGLGYTINTLTTLTNAGDAMVCSIDGIGIEVLLTFMANENYEIALCGISAPAEYVAPELIGENATPICDKDVVYWPNGYYTWAYYDNLFSETDTVDQVVSGGTMIGVVSEDSLGTYWGPVLMDVAAETACAMAEYMYGENASSATCIECIENDTHILIAVEPESLADDGKCAWYKYDKENYTATFIKEGPYQADRWKISKNLWFSEYLDFAQEFPDLYDITPGSDSWDKAVKDAIIEKTVDLAEGKYLEGLSNYEPYHVVAENDTHILICVDPREIHLYEGAWYKGNKQTGEVVFLRQGPYIEVLYWNRSGNIGIAEHRIAEYLWFKEYSDFANEFPAFYGTPNNEGTRYSTQLPYSISFDSRDEECPIYREPAYGSGYVGDLSDENNTIVIVEHQYDEHYDFWGKLSTGEGWVCLSSIWEELERKGLAWECNKTE